MPRKKLPDDEKRVNLSATVLPEIAAGVESFAFKRRLNISQAIEVLLEKALEEAEKYPNFHYREQPGQMTPPDDDHIA